MSFDHHKPYSNQNNFQMVIELFSNNDHFFGKKIKKFQLLDQWGRLNLGPLDG